jgi:glycogen(starch) synthase
LHIAYISFEYPPDSANGGIATYLGQAAPMMARRGHEVEVFAASPVRNETVLDNGVRVHWLRETDREKFGDRIEQVFAARHAESPFDVLEGPDYSADARRAADLVPDVPLVVKMHTPMLMVFRLNRPRDLRGFVANALRQGKRMAASLVRGQRPRFTLARPALQWAGEWNRVEKAHAGQASLIATPSWDLGEFAVKEWGVPRDRIRHAPYPYTPAPAFLDAQQAGDGRTVGFIGRLERRKGIEDLAKAIPQVLAVVPDARFRFIGAIGKHQESGQPYDAWIREKVGRGAAERLDFVGRIEPADMAAALAQLDVVVLPSLWENFPNVCLEAMAAGRAIVASQAGGMREMLDEGSCGVLVKPRDPACFAQAVINLLRHPAERQRLGALARQRVLEVYNEDVIGELYEEIYGEAARRGKNLNAESLKC